MTINSIKTAKVFAEPGKYACVAETEIENNGEILYTAVQEYNAEDCTVSKQSMFAFLAEDGADPVEEFLAEYDSMEEAEHSEYRAGFAACSAAIGLLKLGDMKNGVA